MKFIGFCLSFVLSPLPVAHAISMVWEVSVRHDGVKLKLDPRQAALHAGASAFLSSKDLTLTVTALGETPDTVYTAFEVKSPLLNQNSYKGYWEISKNSRSEWMGDIGGAIVRLKAQTTTASKAPDARTL